MRFLEAAEARGLGLSAFVSIGNKADVSSNDLLEWWEDDPHTDVVLLYLESFGNPRRFGRLARRVARRKPILSLKSGTTLSGQRAASSHTAALAGSDAAVDALFHQAGVIRATSLEELIDVGALLSSQPETKGRRVGLLTNAGGLGILCADVCDAVGLELPEPADETRAQLAALLSAEASLANPVDMLGGATADTYGKALAAMLGDPHLDALIVLFVPTVTATADDVAVAIDRVVAESAAGKPVLAVVMTALAGSRSRSVGVAGESLRSRTPSPPHERSGERRNVPSGFVVRTAPFRRSPASIAGRRRSSSSLRSRAATTSGSRRRRRERCFLRTGFRSSRSKSQAAPTEAAGAARELGFPVVVKTTLAGAHKTDVGGLALDLGDEDAVHAAVERIGAPVLVQPMVKGSAELLAGIVQDPVFGPLVACGPGGVLAELIGEAGFRIAPLTDHDAEELVLGGKTGRLVGGFRGAPAADSRALVDVVHRLARLGEDLDAVTELDLNPVIAQVDGCVVVDSRVRVQRQERLARLKSW